MIDPITGQPVGSSGQPIIGSAESIRFNQQSAYWSTPTDSVENSTANQVASAVIKGGIGIGILKLGPGVHAEWGETFANTRFKTEPINATRTVDFWYQFGRRVENTSSFGPYLSSIFNIFAKSAYMTEAMSVFVDRGTSDYVLDISEKALGKQGKMDTLRVMAKELGLGDTFISDLMTVDDVVFRNGQLLKGSRGPNGIVQAVGPVLSNNARLIDRGKFFEAYLYGEYDWSGILNDEGGSRAQGVFKDSRYGIVGNKGGFGEIGSARSYIRTAQAYTTMALNRTSSLVKDMFNEFGHLFEYISPSAKKNLYGYLRGAGMVPNLGHGNSFAMLGKYTGLAGKAFATLAVVNQAGHWMSKDGALGQVAGGAIQTGMLAYAGSRIASLLKHDPRMGIAVGAGLGISSMLGLGPFDNGIIPGAAKVIGNLNYFRSYAFEKTGMNSVKRWIEKAAPGSTDFTTAIGLGIAGGAAYTAYMKFSNRDHIPTMQAREAYLKGLDWNSVEDLLGRNVSQDPDRIKGYSDLTDKLRDSLHEEVKSYADRLTKENRLSLLKDRFGSTGDTAAVKAKELGLLLQSHSYEAVRESILKEEGHWLSKLNKVISHASTPRSLLYAAAAGTAISALATFQFATLDTPETVRGKNRGDILEAVRRGQNWEFGPTPYQGDDILYYRPTWIARARSGATQSGASGDRGMLHEFFLKNFTFQLERQEYWDRPAPVSSAAFDGTPFIYPLIKPVADLIKRAKLMHVSEWARMNGENVELIERSTGLDALPDPSLGGTAMSTPVSPYSPSRVWGQAWQELTALSGIVGFYARELKGNLTGSTGFGDQRPELESWSENIDMVSRFYQLHTGGGFLGVPFISEPIRRFLVKKDTSIPTYNPIENNLPYWMHESQRYGNPYTGLRYGEGEYRMPGEGYAALHPELQGVDPNNYPLIHRLKILADTASYSLNYRSAAKDAITAIEMGAYNSDQARAIYEIIANQSKRSDKKSYNMRAYNSDQYQQIVGKVESINLEDLTFSIEGYGGSYALAGISNDIGDIIGQLNQSYTDAARQVEKNKELFAGAISPGSTVSVTVPKSIGHAVNSSGAIESQVNVQGENVNRLLSSTGGYGYSGSVMAEYALASGIQKMIGSGWETVTHGLGKMTAPIEHLGSFGMAPMMKFLPFRSAIEDYEAREVYGTSMKMWQQPLSDWFAPAIKTALHNWVGLDFESPYLAKKRDIDEYFDKLKYYKYRMLESEAVELNNTRLAKQYQTIAGETIYGSRGLISQSQLKNRLGGADEKYALGFSRTIDQQEQMQIMEELPDHKRKLMAQHYAYRDKAALESLGVLGDQGVSYLENLIRLEAQDGYEATEKMQENYNAEKTAQESYGDFQRRKGLERYFKRRNIPQTDWIGFNPAVDLEDVKLKYIEKEGMDYHDFGIYPSRAAYMHRKPYINNDSVRGLNHSSLGHARSAIREAMRMTGTPYSNASYNIQGSNRDTNVVTLNIDQSHEFLPFNY